MILKRLSESVVVRKKEGGGGGVGWCVSMKQSVTWEVKL